jgi:hypothetical protein
MVNLIGIDEARNDIKEIYYIIPKLLMRDDGKIMFNELKVKFMS